MGRFPRFSGTVEVLRRPESVPPRFVSFAWQYREGHRRFAPTGCGRPLLWAWTFGHPEPSPGLVRGDLRVLPGSWADPLVYMPWADTPGDPPRQARFSAEDVAFRSAHDVGSPLQSLEAGYHGLHTCCLRFAATGYPADHARLASGGGATPYRVGFGPTRSTTKGFRSCLLHFPSSLPWLTLARGPSLRYRRAPAPGRGCGGVFETPPEPLR
jgi:hypothetical protein